MARILIAAINYWPEPSGTAPYTTQFAEHLAARGADVSVLTGMPHYPAWRVSPAYARVRRATESKDGVTIIRRSHLVPSTQSALSRAAYEASFFVHALVLRGRWDATIGIVPSLNGGALARVHARRRYGVIFQDVMGSAVTQSGIRGGRSAVATATRAAERWVVRKARAVGAVSESFFPYLLGLGVDQTRLMHVPNWPLARPLKPSTDERDALRAELGWGHGVQVALHAGNMGLKQGLEQVVDAARIAEATGEPVRFVLMGEGNQRQALEKRASGVAAVTFLPSQPTDSYMRILAAADVLLVSERATAVSMSLPSKLTSYYVAGRPIVAAVPPEGGTAAEVRRSGAGMVVPSGRPDELLACLRHLRTRTDAAHAFAEAGAPYAEARLGRGAALARLETLTERVLGGPAGPAA